MYFYALASDYDGTLASHGLVAEATLDAIASVKKTGRKLILVTGRMLPDLIQVFPQHDLFDLVVAENGALLYVPSSKEEVLLTEPPPAKLVQRLRAADVVPLDVGRSIVATWQPHEGIVLDTIRDLGLDLQIVFNKGAVMVLPSNVNKASGLSHALKRLGLSEHNVVGIGDAENDIPFLRACGCGVAVGNALESVKNQADLVVADDGAGVVELIGLMSDDSLQTHRRMVVRNQPILGMGQSGHPVHLSPFDTVLLCGASGAGKSTAATALLEQMIELKFQFCVVDPEGDYSEIAGAIPIGDAKHAPSIAEILELLEKPDVNVVVNLVGVSHDDRPDFFAELLPTWPICDPGRGALIG